MENRGAPESAPEGAPGNRGAPESALEGALLAGAPRFPTAPSEALSRSLPGNSRLAPPCLAVLIVALVPISRKM